MQVLFLLIQNVPFPPAIQAKTVTVNNMIVWAMDPGWKLKNILMQSAEKALINNKYLN